MNLINSLLLLISYLTIAILSCTVVERIPLLTPPVISLISHYIFHHYNQCIQIRFLWLKLEGSLPGLLWGYSKILHHNFRKCILQKKLLCTFRVPLKLLYSIGLLHLNPYTPCERFWKKCLTEGVVHPEGPHLEGRRPETSRASGE